jgi:hypothetical protein
MKLPYFQQTAFIDASNIKKLWMLDLSQTPSVRGQIAP